MNRSSNSSLALPSQFGTPNVIDIPDLVNLIADFCDDESLSKLSRVCEPLFTMRANVD